MHTSPCNMHNMHTLLEYSRVSIQHYIHSYKLLSIRELFENLQVEDEVSFDSYRCMHTSYY